MKAKILLLLIILCLSATAYGQRQGSFHSFFGQESTVWNGVTEYYDVPYENHVLRTGNDTLIDGEHFFRIRYSGGFGRSDMDFFLQEDTTTGRLWCRYQDGDHKFIMVDLSLSIGDSIMLPHNMRYMDTILYVVQDTLTQDGRYTLVLADLLFGGTIKFIEGVGCSNLFSYMRMPIISSHLICCHKDGGLVYYSPHEYREDVDCIIPFVGIDDGEMAPAIQVWPNPCDDWVYINSAEHIISAKIHDMTGHLLMDNYNCKDRIYLKDMPKGPFVLSIETEHSKLRTKIIRQ